MSKRTKQEKPIVPIQSGSTTIRNCPVTQASTGVIKLPTTLITEIAGAVQHHLEWALLLYGEFESDTVARIDRWEIPKQDRSGGEVQIAPHKMPRDLMGVMHSHHKLGIGANWSATDINELNPGYPTSIVVAQYKPPSPPRPESAHEFTERIFGFCFKAEGKIPLPCGKLGWCEWEVAPYDADDGGEFDEWNYEGEIVQHTNPVASLGKCPSREVEFVEGFEQTEVAACGVRTEPVRAVEWWGATGELMAWLREQDRTEAAARQAAQPLVKVYQPALPQRNYAGTIINPLHESAPVRYYEPLVEGVNAQNIQAFVKWMDSTAEVLNRKLVVGLKVPKTTTPLTQQVKGEIHVLVCRCIVNPSWLTTEDFSFDLRRWFAPIFEEVNDPWHCKLQFSPSKIVEALHTKEAAYRIFDFLTELSELSAMTLGDNNNPKSQPGFKS